MATLFETRRYLSNFDAARTGHVFTDVLVIGSGAAGARAALEAAAGHAGVVLITKHTLYDNNTSLAQGGVAAAMDEDDAGARHRDDTLRVGGGLNHPGAVELAVREGPREIQQLIEWGMPFDKAADGFALAREGGHRTARILHAEGDSTGRALIETLVARLRREPRVRIFEHCFVIDLLTTDAGCLGAVTYHQTFGHQLIWAQATILAGGGCGRLFRETTNPPEATGDALAIAYRAGARLRDLEMVQFHPTALYVAGSSRALISEAVRGEGAHLVDHAGHRFMSAFHPDAELAPRDVVSRAIVATLARTRATNVFLDVRHLDKQRFAERFPRITRCCADFGIDVGRDLIPVRPAAHYLVGGVVTDLDARTAVPRLYACGECASTGLHGANRLASNSLLEALVFGRIAGHGAGCEAAAHATPSGPLTGRSSVKGGPVDLRHAMPQSPKTDLDLADVSNSLRSLMWRNVGILRQGDRLQETVEIIEFWGRFVLDKVFDAPAGWEVQNMLTLGRLMAAAALHRQESRGVHYREDFPQPREETQPCHVIVERADNALRVESVPKSR